MYNFENIKLIDGLVFSITAKTKPLHDTKWTYTE